MLLRKVALGTIIGMVIIITFMMMTGNAAAADAPIVINGDAAMGSYASSHSLSGNGSSANPYIIQGLNIDADDEVNGLVADLHIHTESAALRNIIGNYVLITSHDHKTIVIAETGIVVDLGGMGRLDDSNATV